MDDITIRLRRGFGGIVPVICDEAANEIDRLKNENNFMRYLITQILNDLPVNRDWLDPDIEIGLKQMCNIGLLDPRRNKTK